MPSLLCQSLAFLKVVNRTSAYSCFVRVRPSVSIFQVKLIPELALIQNWRTLVHDDLLKCCDFWEVHRTHAELKHVVSGLTDFPLEAEWIHSRRRGCCVF